IVPLPITHSTSEHAPRSSHLPQFHPSSPPDRPLATLLATLDHLKEKIPPSRLVVLGCSVWATLGEAPVSHGRNPFFPLRTGGFTHSIF
ncbi:hypothetical protein BDN71DRAFT_1457190, partial [Pleurotus eryngii]